MNIENTVANRNELAKFWGIENDIPEDATHFLTIERAEKNFITGALSYVGELWSLEHGGSIAISIPGGAGQPVSGIKPGRLYFLDEWQTGRRSLSNEEDLTYLIGSACVGSQDAWQESGFAVVGHDRVWGTGSTPDEAIEDARKSVEDPGELEDIGFEYGESLSVVSASAYLIHRVEQDGGDFAFHFSGGLLCVA